MLKRIILFLCCLVQTLAVVPAVVAQSATGLPSYETVAPINPYESINVGNLNLVLQAPVRAKGGPVPVSISLVQNAQLYEWQPLAGHGYFFNSTAGPFALRYSDYWTGGLQKIDQNTYTVCNGAHSEIYLYTGIIDAAGTVHSLPANTKWDSLGCYYTPTAVVTTDNSGFVMQEYANSGDSSFTVYNRSGVNSSRTRVQDPHGNTLTIGSSSVTDQLSSTPVLTWGNGSGGTVLYTYTDGTGTQQTITELDDYTTGMETNFNQQLCGVQNSSTGARFPLSLTYPDGSVLAFAWQKTSAGFYSGYLSTVKIPTGATYTHTYSGGTTGEGFWCDNTNHILTLATLTISNGTGTWTFVRTVGGGTYPNRSITTTMTKPDGSKIVYTFIGDQSPIITGKTVYDTNGTTVLDTMTYCYNSTISSCNPTPPVQNPSVVRAYHYVPGVTLPAETDTHYDQYGNILEVDRYDFGPTLVEKTINYMGNNNPSTGVCDPAPAHIPASVCASVNENASGTILSGKWFTYDSSGNLTQLGDATGLESFYTYNSNGTLATSKLPDGVQTTYTNAQCNGLLPDSATTSIGTVHETWDCNGAVPLTTTDLNGLVTTTTYGDPLYRVTQVSDNGGQAPVNFLYPSPNTTRKYKVFNGTASLVETSSTVNSLGQVISVQHEQGWGLNWDTQSFSYDATGHLASTSQYCTAALGATCPSTAETYTYDGANRPLTATTNTTPNGALSFSYQNGDVTTTLSPAPTGENTKTTVTERDGLGRVTGACVIASLPGVGNCGLRTTSGGYATKYTLDAMGRPTQISRNAQAGGTPRNTNISYDGLSRITQMTTPESGTSYRYYDTPTTSCSSALAGHLSQTTDGNGNIACRQYDSMGRLSYVSYPAGPNAAVTKEKSFVYDGASWSGSATHALGRLSGAATCDSNNSCSSGTTFLVFGYDVYGRESDVWQTSPSISGSWIHTSASYLDNGALATLGGIPGVSNYTFTVDGEGRPYTAKSGSQTQVSSVTYDSASNPLTVTYGTGDIDTYQWDPATENATQYQFKLGSAGTTDTGVLTWNPNGTLQKLAITDNITSADTQTCTTAHDDLARITSFNCGALWNESYSFSADDAGNVTKSGSLSFSPGYTASNNRMLAPYTYDANGSLLHDATLSQDYTWDANGKMVSAGSASIVNDAFGHMVQKTVSGTTTYYVQSPVGSLGAASSLTAYSSIRVPLPGGATMNYRPGYQLLDHKDWKGSTRLVSTWGNRALYTVLCYGPMGEIYCGSSTLGDLEGSQQDTSSGLYDFDAAHYSAAQGRSISPTGGANGYVKTNSPF
jgi:hypothetical protein